jgi:hypothetical protein
MHTGPMKDSDGEFAGWHDDDRPCRHGCGGTVKRREWDSSCGGYTDYNYRCQNPACGKSWWVDGIDS